MQSELVDAIAALAAEADGVRPADLRVGVDSLTPLVDHYGVDVVKRCLDAVGGHVRRHDGMAHYVVTDEYDSECVQRLLPSADAVVELRSVDRAQYGHGAQQRWHVPNGTSRQTGPASDLDAERLRAVRQALTRFARIRVSP